MKQDQLSVQERLKSYINADRPVIYIQNFDFDAVDSLISEVCKMENPKFNESEIIDYNNADGGVHFKTKMPIGFLNTIQPGATSTQKLFYFLSLFLTEKETKQLIVLKDIHEELRDPVVIARLKSIAMRTMREDNYNVTIIIVSTRMVIPEELEKFITVLDMPAPEREEIKKFLKEYYEDRTLDEALLSDFSLAFKGLSLFEIKQIVDLAYHRTGSLKKEDKPLILQEKEASIKKTGMLEAVRVTDDINNIGGLKNLTNYLKRKAYIYINMAEAEAHGVEKPKGILIVGMPGCGKSLTAKVAASLFNAPLLRLDVGRLLGKYVGESEENLRQALRIAEASAPCVLWIDEIEKAFAGVGRDESGGGVTTRLFGYFLTWMQEKDSMVYVVATANDISSIPPEFLRRGRFDEIFSVDLPNAEERKKIFEIHLLRRLKKQRKLTAFNLDELAQKTKGDTGNDFSGADIESIVRTAIETAFENKRELRQQDLLDAIRKTIPIAKTMSEKIKTLKKCLSQYQIKNASSTEEN